MSKSDRNSSRKTLHGVAGKPGRSEAPKERIPDSIKDTSRNIYETWEEDGSAAIEFRRAYAKLSYEMKQGNKHCFLMTSAMAGEGKSTAAAMMAVTIAKYRNTKTLLMDADLRRPRVHEFFQMPARKGLADALLGDVDIIDTIKDTQFENLKVITCGKRIASPTSLLQADRIADILSELKFYFDTVIIDTTPVLPVSDAAQIAVETDGVIYVVMAGVTQREVVKRGYKILKDSNVDIVGVLVNNASEVLPYYYSYDYYDYKY
ncbi:MAG: CpsD/CapB family tyrosine-protein kinase [bacterium]|nr:CpsD/CapB family tyrosine-protein kinase [bacterium]